MTINDNHTIYGFWDMKWNRQYFYHFGPFFAPLPPPPLTAQKMKILRNDKTPGDISIKHKWNKNHDHMLYCSWYMVRDRCNCYFSFRAVFCPFVPITAQKIEISKKWKKCLEISPFYKIASKIMIIAHTVPEMWHVTQVIIFHFGQFFALLI